MRVFLPSVTERYFRNYYKFHRTTEFLGKDLQSLKWSFVLLLKQKHIFKKIKPENFQIFENSQKVPLWQRSHDESTLYCLPSHSQNVWKDIPYSPAKSVPVNCAWGALEGGEFHLHFPAIPRKRESKNNPKPNIRHTSRKINWLSSSTFWKLSFLVLLLKLERLKWHIHKGK